MKKCELCKSVARMYCDSDQASLCWDCDSRVHTANFLVSKHNRTLLCHACQSPTPWTGSGPKLGPTVSFCDACVDRTHRNIDGDRDDFQNGDAEEDEDDDEEEEGPRDEDDDDDGENQVVPSSLAPSLASGSSSSGEQSSSSSSRTTTLENARFSYNDNSQGMERPEEKKGTQKVRSWTWRR